LESYEKVYRIIIYIKSTNIIKQLETIELLTIYCNIELVCIVGSINNLAINYVQPSELAFTINN